MKPTELATEAVGGFQVRILDRMTDCEVRQLADVLIDCVEGGASVSFMLPLDRAKAEAFWRDQAFSIEAGQRIVVVAEIDGHIVGTVQVVFAGPENQPHRADIAKMLVHRRARKRGIGAALMRAAENAARAAGKTVLVLDTTPDSDAARLYARLGWIFVGTVPDYALWPHGGLTPTSFYYRKLDAEDVDQGR